MRYFHDGIQERFYGVTDTLEIHTTDRARFKRCRLQWYFESPLQLNLTPIRAKPALTFGTAIHEGLEAYRDPEKNEKWQGNIGRAKQALTSHLEKWLLSFGDEPEEEIEEEYRGHDALGRGMLEHYAETPVVGGIDLSKFQFVWVEKEFKVDITDKLRALGTPIPEGVRVLFSFKPDGMVKDEKGKLWLVEYKTTSKRPSDNTDYLLLDDQCGSYLWGIHEQEGITVQGIIYDMLLKKIPPQVKILKSGLPSTDKRQDTTYGIAVTQLAQMFGGKEKIPPDYREFLQHLYEKGNTFFFRDQVRRNPEEIEMVGKSILAEAKDMLSNPAIYRNPSRYNCSGCAFVAPCIAMYEQGDYQTMLDGLYVKNKDGDLAREKDKE
jgi:hypothetical protein